MFFSSPAQDSSSISDVCLCLLGPVAVISLFALLVLVMGIHIVPEHKRLAVFRLGRFIGSRGPGLVISIPIVDQAFFLNLDILVPDWRYLSGMELDAKIQQLVLHPNSSPLGARKLK